MVGNDPAISLLNQYNSFFTMRVGLDKKELEIFKSIKPFRLIIDTNDNWKLFVYDKIFLNTCKVLSFVDSSFDYFKAAFCLVTKGKEEYGIINHKLYNKDDLIIRDIIE